MSGLHFLSRRLLTQLEVPVGGRKKTESTSGDVLACDACLLTPGRAQWRHNFLTAEAVICVCQNVQRQSNIGPFRVGP